jgi:general secretion pathway protein N
LFVAAVLVAIPLIPLHAAVDMLQLKHFGFEASQVEGNLWEGHMYDVRFANVEVGDVTTKMSLDEVSKGRVKLQLTGNEEATAGLKGAFGFGFGGIGIDRFNLAMPVMAGPPPIGGVTLILDGLSVRFPNGECTDGRGEVRAYLSGALPSVGLPSEMSGPATCTDGKLAFSLASSDGRVEEDVTILTMNKYKVRMFVKPSNPQVTETLQAHGFRPEMDGYSYTEERTLGGAASPEMP